MRIRLCLAVCSAAGALALAGCSLLGGGGDQPAKKGGGGGSSAPAATSPGAPLPGASRSQWVASHYKIRVDILSLDRTSAKAVTARLRITNFGKGRAQISQFTDLGARRFPAGIDSASGVTLVDSVHLKHYYPWFGKDGKCLCTLEDALGSYLETGETVEYFVSFPPPPVRKVMLVFPNTPPFLNVPIGNRPGPVTPPPEQEPRDPAKIPLDAPEIFPFTDYSEAIDGSSEQTEDDQKVEVRLSADVLFALNKAKLTPKAQAVLKQVADRINRSKAKIVKIDGYTDDSGNDAINNPLSKRRAQAVRKALKPLVTKQGIAFKAAGHGSADPVADNNSAENRKRNRRVTVSFAR